MRVQPQSARLTRPARTRLGAGRSARKLDAASHPAELRLLPVALAAMIALGSSDAFAQTANQLPVLKPGGVQLNATVSQVSSPAAGTMNITQTASTNNRGLIEWQSFSIGSGSRVNIAQPNAKSVLVNRVTGNGRVGPTTSEIMGAMSSNGQVFLINPAGIVVGAGAQVNVGSLVATTLDMADSMTANNYNGFANSAGTLEMAQTQFSAGLNTSLQIQQAATTAPQIEVSEGGSIVLLSRDGLSQGGIVSAPRGMVSLSSAQTAVLPLGNSGFIEVVIGVPATGGNALTTEFGSRTLASGGRIVIGAQGRADAALRSDRQLVLAGEISTASATGNGGTIAIDAGSGGSVAVGAGGGGMQLSASSTAAAGTGGQVSILGNQISLQSGEGGASRIEADGTAGGGAITIGDTQTRSLVINSNTSVLADATTNGNGGAITLNALYNAAPGDSGATARTDYGVAEIYGALTARGGTAGGNGGRITTSGISLATSLGTQGEGVFTVNGTVDAGNRNVSGQAGIWLLNTQGVTIGSDAPLANGNGFFEPSTSGAQLRAADISAALDANTSVSISSKRQAVNVSTADITLGVETAIARSTGTTPESLLLSSDGSILFGAGSSIRADKTTGPLAISLIGDAANSGIGPISLQTTQIATAGGRLELSGVSDGGNTFSARDGRLPGVLITDSTIDTSAAAGAAGNVQIVGQGHIGSEPTGVNITGSTFTVGDLTISGRTALGNAVHLGDTQINTASGLIDIRGAAVRTPGSSGQLPSLTGVALDAVTVQLGTGSLSIAGRGDDVDQTNTGFATGVRINTLQVSAAANSTGRITLAGQATGSSTGYGLSANGLVISADAASESGIGAATGANVMLGGISDSDRNAMEFGRTGPQINTSGVVNLRPLGVDILGLITEQTDASITVRPQAPLSSGALSTLDPRPLPAIRPTAVATDGSFSIDSSWLRQLEGSGLTAGQGVVIGSSAQAGAITVQDNALVQTDNLSLTLQNEGTGAAGITLGSGNAVRDLALLSAGNISQVNAGQATQAGLSGLSVSRNLVIRGGAASNVDLSAAGNQIANLAFDPPATLSVRTDGALNIGNATAYTYDAATNTLTPLAITASSAGNTALLRAGGDITIAHSISMTGTGNNATLDIVSPGQVNFANGATLSTAADGRWRVWSPTATNLPTGAGTTQNLYGCSFGDTATCSGSGVAINPNGNQFLSPNRPTLVVTATPASVAPGQPLPNLQFTSTGFVNGDSAATALAGTLATTATANSPAGTYAITQGSVASPTGYLVNFQPASLTLTAAPIPPAFISLDRQNVAREMLQARFSTEISSDVYGRNLAQPYVCTAASLIRASSGDNGPSDPLSSEWGKVRNQPQLSGCLSVGDGGQCSAF